MESLSLTENSEFIIVDYTSALIMSEKYFASTVTLVHVLFQTLTKYLSKQRHLFETSKIVDKTLNAINFVQVTTRQA